MKSEDDDQQRNTETLWSLERSSSKYAQRMSFAQYVSEVRSVHAERDKYGNTVICLSRGPGFIVSFVRTHDSKDEWNVP